MNSWLRGLRTQRNIARGWHVVPVYRNSSDRNVIYTIAPPNKQENRNRRLRESTESENSLQTADGEQFAHPKPFIQWVRQSDRPCPCAETASAVSSLPNRRLREKPSPLNPVTLALAYRRLLDEGEVNNQSHLARKVGLTRARVTQILDLLKLPDSVIRNLYSVSDPKKTAFFSKRRLRSITRLPRAKEQIKAFHDLEKRAAEIVAL